jgi:hypothetical protein
VTMFTASDNCAPQRTGVGDVGQGEVLGYSNFKKRLWRHRCSIGESETADPMPRLGTLIKVSVSKAPLAPSPHHVSMLTFPASVQLHPLPIRASLLGDLIGLSTLSPQHRLYSQVPLDVPALVNDPGD